MNCRTSRLMAEPLYGFSNRIMVMRVFQITTRFVKVRSASELSCCIRQDRGAGSGIVVPSCVTVATGACRSSSRPS